MNNFFFDTANLDYIKNLWDNHLKGKIDHRNIRGITTNPNAFAKIGKNKFCEWFCHIPKMLKLMDYITENDGGEVHIQIPYSNMSLEEVKKYIDLVKIKNDRVFIKIPPRMDILEYTNRYENNINVTGLADCATLLKCKSYYPAYVSIIPGRMEEVGINAKEHVKYCSSMIPNTEIITGSMRTMEQLQWCFAENTIPTIGEKVFNLLIEQDKLHILTQEYKEKTINNDICYPPLTTEANINLSKSFFEQMDKLGNEAYQEFVNEYMV